MLRMFVPSFVYAIQNEYTHCNEKRLKIDCQVQVVIQHNDKKRRWMQSLIVSLFSSMRIVYGGRASASALQRSGRYIINLFDDNHLTGLGLVRHDGMRSWTMHSTSFLMSHAVFNRRASSYQSATIFVHFSARSTYASAYLSPVLKIISATIGCHWLSFHLSCYKWRNKYRDFH